MVKKLHDMVEEAVRCNKCGFCQEVCPTYKVTGEEFAVARGRNRLIRLVLDGKLDLKQEPEIAKYLYDCLLCSACVSVCPSAVVTDKLNFSARRTLAEMYGSNFFKNMIFKGVLLNPRKFKMTAKMVWFYQRSGLQWLARSTGLLKLMGYLGKIEGLAPVAAGTSLRDKLPEVVKKIKNPKHKVGYFLGCLANNFFTSMGEATLRVLGENDVAVEVPEVVCCGVPHMAYGEIELAKEAARKNIDAFEGLGVDAIVTDCASCGHGLHAYAELLEDDPVYGPKAQAFCKKVVDINAYLVEIGFKKPAGEVVAKVTYHDPCHLVRGMKVSNEPREILKAIPGIQFVEMNEANWCCGGAGSYGVTHYDMSMNILDRKMGNFAKTGAELLATACPGCMMQLAHGLTRSKADARTVHTVQLLDQAYQAGKAGSSARAAD